AAGGQQPAPENGQCHPDRARRLSLRPVRSGAAAPRRSRIVIGAGRQMADVLRQPVGARQDRPQALAAGVDGARAEFLTGEQMSMARRSFIVGAGLASAAARWDPEVVRYPDPNVKILDP